MAPAGYADGLLKPANQVRAQKDLVKSVPGSNLPRQPDKQKRVKQSVAQMQAAQQIQMHCQKVQLTFTIQMLELMQELLTPLKMKIIWQVIVPLTYHHSNQ